MILRRIALDPEKAAEAWYFGIPAIAQLADEPLVLDAAVTVIVGENGSGKSTLLEAVAAAWAARLAGEVKHWAPKGGDEDSDLHWALRLDDEYPPTGGRMFPAGRGHAPAVHRGRPWHAAPGVRRCAQRAVARRIVPGVLVLPRYRAGPVHSRRTRSRVVVQFVPAADGADGLTRHRRIAVPAGHPLAAAGRVPGCDDPRARRARPQRHRVGRPVNGGSLAPVPGLPRTRIYGICSPSG